MVVIITLIYIGGTIVFAFNWLFTYSFLVKNGQNIWTKYLVIFVIMDITVLGMDVTDPICTLLSDSLIVCIIYFHYNLLIKLIDLAMLDSVGTAVSDCSTSYSSSCFRNW